MIKFRKNPHEEGKNNPLFRTLVEQEIYLKNPPVKGMGWGK